MSSDEHRITRNVYIAVLSKDEKSPLAPESDEEKRKDEGRRTLTRTKQQITPATKTRTREKKGESRSDRLTKTRTKIKTKDKKDEPVVVKIDIDGIGQRILSLPIPAKNYLEHASRKIRHPVPCGRPDGRDAKTIIPTSARPSRNSISASARSTRFVEDVNDFAVSFDGEKILYRKGDSWSTASRR